MNGPRVVLVAKRSLYTRFVEEEGDPRARLLLRKRDPSVENWREAHADHQRTLEAIQRVLDDLGAHVVVVRRSHAAFDTSDARLVVSVGGDGTLLAASHNVGAVPILGVNSAPRHSVGFFCAARRSNAHALLARALEGRLESVTLTRMAVIVNGRKHSTRVLNEALYSQASPAATSRYILRYGAIVEEQRSSGFWIGPAAGSTAAQFSAGGKVLPLASHKLQLVVREPYLAFKKRYRLLRLVIDDGKHLTVRSKMQDSSLFLDGPYKQVAVRLGDEIRFQSSDEPLTLLGLHRRRARS
jgi:NAD+ kinase